AFGYELARQFGLKVRQTRPALVPLLFAANDRSHYCELAGISAEVIVTSDHQSFREKMLITHRGLSGPVILQISSYWNPGKPIQIDLVPHHNVTEAMRRGTVRDMASARSVFQEVLPNRLAVRWLDLHAPRTWTNEALTELERQVHAWTLIPSGT